jgi:hypothetical protein
VIIRLSLSFKSGIVLLWLAADSSLQFFLVGKWQPIAASHTLKKCTYYPNLRVLLTGIDSVFTTDKIAY